LPCPSRCGRQQNLAEVSYGRLCPCRVFEWR
jgi:hypothetical protein